MNMAQGQGEARFQKVVGEAWGVLGPRDASLAWEIDDLVYSKESGSEGTVIAIEGPQHVTVHWGSGVISKGVHVNRLTNNTMA